MQLLRKLCRASEQRETGKAFEESKGRTVGSQWVDGGWPITCSECGRRRSTLFYNCFVPGGAQQTTPFVGGLQQGK